MLLHYRQQLAPRMRRRCRITSVPGQGTATLRGHRLHGKPRLRQQELGGPQHATFQARTGAAAEQQDRIGSAGGSGYSSDRDRCGRKSPATKCPTPASRQVAPSSDQGGQRPWMSQQAAQCAPTQGLTVRSAALFPCCHQQIEVAHLRWAHAFANPTTQALIQMQSRFGPKFSTRRQCLGQRDPAAWRFRFVAADSIGRAMRQTQPAFHASAGQGMNIAGRHRSGTDISRCRHARSLRNPPPSRISADSARRHRLNRRKSVGSRFETFGGTVKDGRALAYRPGNAGVTIRPRFEFVAGVCDLSSRN